MAKGYWEIITIKAGAVEEKSKHFVAADPDSGKARGKTSAKKQKYNDENAARRLARLLNLNFKPGDTLLGLDYDDEHLAKVEERARKMQREAGDTDLTWADFIRKAAEHELRLCLDRVRRECKKQNMELKYVAVTSDMDGETGELVRIHHHLVIDRDCLEIFRKKWGKGRCVGKPIQQQKDLTAIAEYMVRQVRRVPNDKIYMPSRNLKQPTVFRRQVSGPAELRVPKGCELLYRAEYEPGWSGVQYIRYFRPTSKWPGCAPFPPSVAKTALRPGHFSFSE